MEAITKRIDLDYQTLEFWNLDSLIDSINKFRNCLLPASEHLEEVFDLFRARTYFESCLSIIKSIINPEKNTLIENLKTNHESFQFYNASQILEKFFDNFMSILDKEFEDFYQLDNQGYKKVDPYVPVQVRSVREKLKDYMNSLILFPLQKSFQVYSTLQTEKTKEVFEYILFREVLIASSIKGSEMRQKLIMSGGGGASFHETNIIKSPRSRSKSEPIQQNLPMELIPPGIEEFTDIFAEETEGGENVPVDR